MDTSKERQEWWDGYGVMEGDQSGGTSRAVSREGAAEAATSERMLELRRPC